MKYSAQWMAHGVILEKYPIEQVICEDSKAKQRQIDEKNNDLKQEFRKKFMKSLAEIAKSEHASFSGKPQKYEFNGVKSPNIYMNFENKPLLASIIMNLGNTIKHDCCGGLVSAPTSFFCELKADNDIPVGEAHPYMSKLTELSERLVEKVSKDCIGINAKFDKVYLKALGIKAKLRPCYASSCTHTELRDLNITLEMPQFMDSVYAMLKEDIKKYPQLDRKEAVEMAASIFRGFKQRMDKLFKDPAELMLLMHELAEIHGKQGKQNDQRIYDFYKNDWFMSKRSIVDDTAKWTGVSTISWAEGISKSLEMFLLNHIILDNEFAF